AGGSTGHLNRERCIHQRLSGSPRARALVRFFSFYFFVKSCHEGARVNESYLAAREPLPYPFAPVILTGDIVSPRSLHMEIVGQKNRLLPYGRINSATAISGGMSTGTETGTCTNCDQM